MEIQVILWLDRRVAEPISPISYLRDVIKTFCKENNINLFLFDDVDNYIQKVIELDGLGTKYLVITEVFIAGLELVFLPKSIYPDLSQAQVVYNKVGQKYLLLKLHQALFDFVIVDGSKYKSHIKKPPIIVFSVADLGEMVRFERINLGEGFFKGIFCMFGCREEKFLEMIKSL